MVIIIIIKYTCFLFWKVYLRVLFTQNRVWKLLISISWMFLSALGTFSFSIILDPLYSLDEVLVELHC